MYHLFTEIASHFYNFLQFLPNEKRRIHLPYQVHDIHTSQYLLSDNTKKVEEIREEDIRVEYITKIVELHFESSAFEKGLQTSRSYMDVNGDGSKYKGWVIVLSSLNRELTIRPYWAFYHK